MTIRAGVRPVLKLMLVARLNAEGLGKRIHLGPIGELQPHLAQQRTRHIDLAPVASHGHERPRDIKIVGEAPARVGKDADGRIGIAGRVQRHAVDVDVSRNIGSCLLYTSDAADE